MPKKTRKPPKNAMLRKITSVVTCTAVLIEGLDMRAAVTDKRLPNNSRNSPNAVATPRTSQCVVRGRTECETPGGGGT